MNARDLPVMRQDTLTEVLLCISENCEGLQGAALVTAAGEVLAACGDLQPEAVAELAAGLPLQLDLHLGRVCTGFMHEALVWTDTGPWYLCRVDEAGHALVLKAGPIEHAAQLRYAGALAANRVERLMAALQA